MSFSVTTTGNRFVSDFERIGAAFRALRQLLVGKGLSKIFHAGEGVVRVLKHQFFGIGAEDFKLSDTGGALGVLVKFL